MSSQAPNLEEAANVAAEFIYNLDNLPNEVSHLLQEIKHRETRTQELQSEIDKDSAKYIRRSRRTSSTSATPPSPSPSSRAPSPKSVPIPARITASYAEIQELATEKCNLAEKLIEIITRTRSKLDVDITKVRILQGESPEAIAASKPLSAHPTLSADNLSLPNGLRNLNAAFAIGESLRNALAPSGSEKGTSAAASPSAVSSSGHANKKRRVTQTTSIKISPAASPTKHRSASPTTAAPATHTHQKSRLSRQVHPPTEDEDNDVDGDGDEEVDGEDDGEDETLYCFCRKQSYGDMIACDNEGGCPYEWFHLSCVGLKQPTPEKWYCDACIRANGFEVPTPPPAPPTTTTRKGRRK